jgi:hypothetical protein
VHGAAQRDQQVNHVIWTLAMRRRTRIILAMVGLAVLLPFIQIPIIVAEAQYFASGRPYCIQASDGRFGEYRSVRSLLELNGFTLRAPFVDSKGSIGFAQWTFHALLAVDDGNEIEWRNWSYSAQHFDWLTPQQVKAAGLYRTECVPKVDFALKLPPLFACGAGCQEPGKER